MSVFRDKLFGKSQQKDEEISEENSKEEEKAVKEEYTLSTAIEAAIKKYKEKRLVGSVSVERTFLIFTSSITVEIDGTEQSEEGSGEGDEAPSTTAEEDAATEKEKKTLLYKLALKGLDRNIFWLLRRSQSYRNKPYKDSLTITSSKSLSDPLGFWTITVECSASVQSLLDCVDASKKA